MGVFSSLSPLPVPDYQHTDRGVVVSVLWVGVGDNVRL